MAELQIWFIDKQIYFVCYNFFIHTTEYLHNAELL